MNSSDNILKLAEFFQNKSEAGGIVVITDNPSIINKFPAHLKIFVVKTYLQLARRKASGPHLPPNATMIRRQDLTPTFLKDKILVCIDYLERRPAASQWLKKAANDSLLTVLTVESKRLWTAGRLAKIAPGLQGYAKQLEEPTKRPPMLSVCGRLASVHHHNYPKVKALAIIAQYNEADVIEATVGHLLSQGVDVHVIDNWSDDGSFELVQETAKHHPGRVTYERFPSTDRKKYEWAKLLNRITEVAKQKKQYDWVIFNDADEIRWSPWENINLQQALSFVDALGFNSVDYTVFNFAPTREGFKQGTDPVTFFEFGEFPSDYSYFVQIKTWKNHASAELAKHGGHAIDIPNRKIFPLKFLLCHYPLRSSEHARKKIFKERMPRFVAQERKKGWHYQYDDADESQSFIRSSSGLIPYPKKFLKDYLLQRISGLGIKMTNSPDHSSDSN